MGAWQMNFEAIGTRWTITFDGSNHAQLQTAIRDRIEDFDRCYSRFRDDSLVSQMAQRAGRYELPADGFKLLQFYERLYHLSDGLVTPLIGQTMVDAGYDSKYSLQPKVPTVAPAWHEVIKYDQDSITLSQSALLDFGAAGKGYLVDLLAELIATASIQEFTINAGGDIIHRGQPITVGLENPLDEDEAIGTIKLMNQSLCASSTSDRDWGQYHHIINPKTVSSPRDILSVWVLADDCMTADGLATSLFLVPPLAFGDYKFAYAILRTDMSLEQSPNFPAKIFTAA